MTPTRGFRSSGSNVGLVRRRIGLLPIRQFSSAPPRPIAPRSPLFLQNAASPLRVSASLRTQFSKPGLLIRNATSIRLASTAPQTSTPRTAPGANATATSPDPTASSAGAPPAEFVSPLDDTLNFTSDDLSSIPAHIGYLKDLGIDYGWGPTSIMQWILEHVHVFAGTPWWVSISVTAIIVRAALFKPYIDAADNSAKIATVRPVIQPLSVKMNEARVAGDTTAMMQHRAEMSRINKRAGIKMIKSVVPLIQAFAGYGTFRLLRGMAALPVPGLEDGGVAWFYNLTLPDPYFILPLATAGLLHWLLRTGGETGMSTVSPTVQRALQWFFPAITLLATWWLPASVQLSFLVSGVLSFLQATLMRQPWFRRYFDMTPPPTPSGAPPPRYQGNLRKAEPIVLSEAQVNSRFQKPLTGPSQPPPTGLKKFMAPMLKPLEKVKDDAKGVLNMATEKMDERRQKSERQDAKRYEERRQRELEIEEIDRLEQEIEERAQRAAARKARKARK